MGIDITLFVEERVNENQWELAESPVKNPFFHPDDPECETETKLIPKVIDLDRCYSLFAILANVRNGSHAEGEFNFISEPKGIPQDISVIGNHFYQSFGDASENASWLTSAEIEKFNWSQLIQREACVVPEVAHLFRKNPLGFPFKDWPKHIPVSYSSFMKDGKLVRWRETYAQAAEYELFKEQLLSFWNADRYRYVFWFS